MENDCRGGELTFRFSSAMTKDQLYTEIEADYHPWFTVLSYMQLRTLNFSQLTLPVCSPLTQFDFSIGNSLQKVSEMKTVTEVSNSINFINTPLRMLDSSKSY